MSHASANGERPLPPGWEWRPLGDFLVESRIPGSSGVDARKLTVKLYGKGVEAKSERRLGSENTRYYVRRAGQFIYSKLDFLNGAFGIVPEHLDGYESTLDVPAFDIRPGIEPAWVLNFVAREDFYKAQAQKARGGRKARRLAPEDFLRLKIAVPPEPIQGALTEGLADLDLAVSANVEAIDHLTRAQRSLVDEMMRREAEQWDSGTLDDICAVPVTYGIVQAGPHVPDGVPYIRTGDMTGDALSVTTLMRTSPALAASYDRSRVRAGEIVCAIRATVGKVLLIPPELDGANLTQGTARISPKPIVRARFLLWALRARAARKQFTRESKGTTFAEITLADLRRLRVSFPRSLDRQLEIADCLESTDAYRLSLIGEMDGLRALRRAIISNAAAGRLALP